MFTSDKDLKKPLQRPKRPSSSSHSSSSSSRRAVKKEHAQASVASPPISSAATSSLSTSSSSSSSLMERTREERRKRELNRSAHQAATRIQSLYRGNMGRRLLFQARNEEFDKKIRGIEEVHRVLLLQKNVILVPPVEVTARLLRLLLCEIWKSSSLSSSLMKPSSSSPSSLSSFLRVVKICRFVLIPSLQEKVSEKNLLSFLSDSSKEGYTMKDKKVEVKVSIHLLVKFVKRVFKEINESSTKTRHDEDAIKQVKDDLLPCISLLLGINTPSELTAATSFGYDKLRRALLFSESSSTPYMILDLISRSFYSLVLTGGHLEAATNGSSTSSSAFCGGGGECSPIANSLMTLCIQISQMLMKEESPANAALSKRLASSILATPLCTYLLSKETLAELSSPSCLQWLLSPFFEDTDERKLRQASSVLPPSPHPVFYSGQWALGNLATLFPHMSLVAEKPRRGENGDDRTLSNALLVAFMTVISALLCSYSVPGAMSGRGGVMWSRVGTTSSASGVPTALHRQFFGLLHRSSMLNLYSRVIRPLPLPRTASFAPSKIASKGDYTVLPAPDEEDVKSVVSALNSSSLKLAQLGMKQRQEEATTSSRFFGLGVTSIWAKKLSTSLSSMFFGEAKASGAPDVDVLASYSGRASGVEGKELSSGQSSQEFQLNLEAVNMLCRMWSLLLPAAAGAPPDSVPWKSLSSLCFSTEIIGRLWGYVVNASCFCKFHFASKNDNSYEFDFSLSRDLCLTLPMVSTPSRPPLSSLVSAMAVIVAVFRVLLVALDDSELYEQEVPFPLAYLLPFIRCLNRMVHSAICDEPKMMVEVSASPQSRRKAEANDSSSIERVYQMDVLRCAVTVLADLHTRWARRPFAQPVLWEIKDTITLRGEMLEVLRASTSTFTAVASSSQRGHRCEEARALLRLLPWTLHFFDRVRLFRDVLASERLAVQGSDDVNQGDRSRGTIVRVRRQRLLLDGIAALDRVGSAIKDRVVVRYVNDFGEDESGIDIGGLFKDFLVDLSERVFDPSFGLFSLTEQQLLYPHPSASLLLAQDEAETAKSFIFMGRILGKALFEDITIQPQFAHFFLAFMIRKYNFTGLLNDLASLDADIYRNLLFLKSFEGDLADLCLTFSATDEALGVHKEVEFFPGGADVAVTNENKHRYIQMAAKYYLHDRIAKQARAFIQGIHDVISPDLLGMFCAPELQVLISGADSEIDIADLKAHTRYAGGYSAVHPVVRMFWEAVEPGGALSDLDRALLVKFVTSCQRPPSLGFGALSPVFTIQRVESDHDSRLPTASTCFNVLKLPAYSSKRHLVNKLLAAIRSKSGFELS